jgi:hypothetical protein
MASFRDEGAARRMTTMDGDDGKPRGGGIPVARAIEAASGAAASAPLG